MLPKFGQRSTSSKPSIAFPAPRRKSAGLKPATLGQYGRGATPTWDIGPGPFWIQGQKASRPEYIIYRALQRLGWHPDFQSSIMWGRLVMGGQVLDIVLNEHQPPIVINVQSYWHRGAAANYEATIKRLFAESSIAGAKVIDIWEEDIDQYHWLEDFLLREVGAFGR